MPNSGKFHPNDNSPILGLARSEPQTGYLSTDTDYASPKLEEIIADNTIPDSVPADNGLYAQLERPNRRTSVSIVQRTTTAQYAIVRPLDWDPSTVNKGGLSAILDYVDTLDPDDYLPDGWSDLQDAIQDGQIVLDDPDATQLQVNDAISAIQDAINQLMPVVPACAFPFDASITAFFPGSVPLQVSGTAPVQTVTGPEIIPEGVTYITSTYNPGYDGFTNDWPADEIRWICQVSDIVPFSNGSVSGGDSMVVTIGSLTTGASFYAAVYAFDAITRLPYGWTDQSQESGSRRIELPFTGMADTFAIGLTGSGDCYVRVDDKTYKVLNNSDMPVNIGVSDNLYLLHQISQAPGYSATGPTSYISRTFADDFIGTFPEVSGINSQTDLCGNPVEVVPVDKSALDDILQSIDTMDPNDYTPESWNDLLDAVANAQGVMDNPNADQSMVNDAITELQQALDNLEYIGIYIEMTPFHDEGSNKTYLYLMPDGTINDPLTNAPLANFSININDEDYIADSIEHHEVGGIHSYLATFTTDFVIDEPMPITVSLAAYSNFNGQVESFLYGIFHAPQIMPVGNTAAYDGKNPLPFIRDTVTKVTTITSQVQYDPDETNSVGWIDIASAYYELADELFDDEYVVFGLVVTAPAYTDPGVKDGGVSPGFLMYPSAQEGYYSWVRYEYEFDRDGTGEYEWTAQHTAEGAPVMDGYNTGTSNILRLLLVMHKTEPARVYWAGGHFDNDTTLYTASHFVQIDKFFDVPEVSGVEIHEAISNDTTPWEDLLALVDLPPGSVLVDPYLNEINTPGNHVRSTVVGIDGVYFTSGVSSNLYISRLVFNLDNDPAVGFDPGNFLNNVSVISDTLGDISNGFKSFEYNPGENAIVIYAQPDWVVDIENMSITVSHPGDGYVNASEYTLTWPGSWIVN